MTARGRQMIVTLAVVTVLGFVGGLRSEADPVKKSDQIAGAASQRQIGLAEAVQKQSARTVSKAGDVSLGPHRRKSGTVSEKPARREKTDKLAVSKKATSADVFDSIGAKNGGCRPEYGLPGQCLPQTIPHKLSRAGRSKKTWTCAQVRTLFPGGIALRTIAVDPLQLDRDGDNTACGPRD